MKYSRYLEYKESGVAWLGVVPAHWAVLPIKYVASSNDDVLAEDTPEDFEIEYVEISGVDEVKGIISTEIHQFRNAPSRARRRVQDGDIIISTVRTYLKAIASIEHSPANLIVSTGFAVIRPKGPLFTRFASYLFKANYLVSEVIARSTGVSYPAINTSELVKIHAVMPPHEEQITIATFLDRETAQIDTLIAKQERLIALLQEKRQALISHVVTKGLNPDAPMKESGVAWLGEVPAHWEVKRLRRFNCLVQTGPFGSQLHADDYVENGYPVVNPSNILDGKIIPDWSMTVDEATRENLSRHVLQIDDIVFGRRGELGRAAIVGAKEVGWLCGTGSIMIRLYESGFQSDYLAEYLRLPIVKDYLVVKSVGSTMDNLNTGILLDMPLIIPPRDEQIEIVKYCHKMSVKTVAVAELVRRSLNLAKERRSALISAAVTGKIDVRPLIN